MEKIKHFLQSEKGKDILIILVIILVSLISFMLGRMSKNSPNNDLIIKYGNQPGLAINGSKELNLAQKIPDSSSIESLSYTGPDLKGREYFASKRGKKYYPFGCSAGKSIKEENRIYFSSEYEAQAKGYALSTSCE